MRRLTWDELHPEHAGKKFCRWCERPVGDYHLDDCPRYPHVVIEKEGVR